MQDITAEARGHGRAARTAKLVALADGYRESAESWADLLRDGRPIANALDAV